jgi:hypothetical protein
MQKAIEIVENEIKHTERVIEYYLSKGNPTIEIIEPNLFKKREELIYALNILKKYNTSNMSCNLSDLNLIELMNFYQ